MIINGPWSWSTYIKNGIDIGLARIPMIDETGLWPTPTVFPMGYCFNVNLKNEKLQVTKSLVDYLTSPQVTLMFARKFNIIPSRNEAFADTILQSKKLIQQAIDQMQVGRSLPVVTEIRWIFDAMRPAYQSIFTGGVTAEEAARNMQVLAERLIREGRK
jgi:maltose-binding protein MalE